MCSQLTLYTCNQLQKKENGNDVEERRERKSDVVLRVNVELFVISNVTFLWAMTAIMLESFLFLSPTLNKLREVAIELHYYRKERKRNEVSLKFYPISLELEHSSTTTVNQ